MKQDENWTYFIHVENIPINKATGSILFRCWAALEKNDKTNTFGQIKQRNGRVISLYTVIWVTIKL